MFAVIKTGGKQYRVAAQDMLKIDRLKGEPGEIVQFGEVLLVGGDAVTLGNPTIAGASVAAEVLQQGRGPKIIAFKKRRRKNSRRKRGFRPEFTLVRITEILTDGQAPTMTASVRRENVKRAPVEAVAQEEADEGADAPVKAKAKGKAKAGKKPAKPAAKKAPKAKSGGKGSKK
jgi:large subunit ribosomal protein L21